MKTKNGYILRPLGTEYILVSEGLEATDANRLISMNESAAFLWKSVEGKEFEKENLVDLLLEEYDITRELAEKDTTMLLETWKEADIVDY